MPNNSESDTADKLHIRSLATLEETTLDSITALEPIAASHQRQVESHERQIEGLVREWQAYLRTLRPPALTSKG